MAEGSNYHVKVVSKIDNGRGYWNSLRVGVFDGEQQVGEYVRNYHSFAETTFCPFEQDGRWFALYSRHYTATRLMSLPDCADLGGEEPDAWGFCPVEYHVPLLTGRVLSADDPEPPVANHDAERWATKVPLADGRWRYYWPDDKDHPNPDPERRAAYLAEKERTHALHDAWMDRYPFVTRHARWGFVAGCVWGDDSSWKIQFLDLSRAVEGVVTRDDCFGYLELPDCVTLKDAIDVYRIKDLNAPLEKQEIIIAQPVRFRLTGERIGEK